MFDGVSIQDVVVAVGFAACFGLGVISGFLTPS